MIRNYTEIVKISLIRRAIGLALVLSFLFDGRAFAYIGPGAGFAVVTSFFFLFVTVLIASIAVLAWPFRALIRGFKLRKIKKYRKTKRVVILGLDGMDPCLTNRYMDQGKLPNFLRLKQQGCSHELKTTTPSISPVAWSTFSTGVNPGKHRIFDFYTRDVRNYLPVLSSVRISSYEGVHTIGPFKIPRRELNIRFLRKSTSFWKILGKHGIFCSILRVPVTFPPEKFYGTCLSAMCTPDLRGTQGSFTLFSSLSQNKLVEIDFGGTHVPIELDGEKFSGEIPGPTLNVKGISRTLTVFFSGRIDTKKNIVQLNLEKTIHRLEIGFYSPWIKLIFKSGFRKRVSGMARFLVVEIKPNLKIYMTPINIDPDKPSLPISYPKVYATGLSKLYGPYSTLGLAEDTWALNTRVINEGDFLKQVYDIFYERRKHLLDALKQNRDGLVVSVFDTADRLQHMFFRYLYPDHPANKNKDTELYRDVIEQLYEKMDLLLGEVIDTLDESNVLFVISDHGFGPFKWGINLNSWLWREGYLVIKEGADPRGEWFADVDWCKTRAYALGLSGIFINLKGREGAGLVNKGDEYQKLCAELKEKLTSLQDKRNGIRPIRRMVRSEEVMKGPYVSEAPDLFVNYQSGYRVSWNSAIGKPTNDVFEDNTRSWSGDHSIDPDLVPGIFFSNWILKNESPSIADIAPTVLNLFGLKPPGFQDGMVLNLRRSDQDL